MQLLSFSSQLRWEPSLTSKTFFYLILFSFIIYSCFINWSPGLKTETACLSVRFYISVDVQIIINEKKNEKRKKKKHFRNTYK